MPVGQADADDADNAIHHGDHGGVPRWTMQPEPVMILKPMCIINMTPEGAPQVALAASQKHRQAGSVAIVHRTQQLQLSRSCCLPSTDVPPSTRKRRATHRRRAMEYRSAPPPCRACKASGMTIACCRRSSSPRLLPRHFRSRMRSPRRTSLRRRCTSSSRLSLPPSDPKCQSLTSRRSLLRSPTRRLRPHTPVRPRPRVRGYAVPA